MRQLYDYNDQNVKYENKIKRVWELKRINKSFLLQIKKYFEIKVKNPEYFYDIDINYYIEVANLRMADMMPRRDHKGRRIFVVRNLGKFDPNLYSVEQLFKGVAMMMEAVSLEPDTQVNGVVIVLDLKELALHHLKPLTPSFIRFGMKWCQDCIPLRLKGLHVINETSMIDATYAIIKNFLSEKLRNRIYFHGKDYEMIHEYIAPNCLPTEYGGTISLGECPKVEELMEMYGEFVERCKKEMDVINSYGYKKDLTENTQLWCIHMAGLTNISGSFFFCCYREIQYYTPKCFAWVNIFANK